MIKKNYQIPDMHCTACVMRLEAIEDDLPGIRSIKASYQKQTLAVEFDEKQVTEGEILEAIRKLDYSPVPMPS